MDMFLDAGNAKLKLVVQSLCSGVAHGDGTYPSTTNTY